MRYLGGMLGGTWLTSLSGDLGGGKFDGANLVANFESLDPANTFFEKPYNVYAKIDTEVERFIKLIEPVLLVVMGIVIAAVVLSLYMPLFQLGSLATGA